MAERTEFKVETVYPANVKFEMSVAIGGYSYLVIYGKHINGGFCCVPNWNWGCEMSTLPNSVAYNQKRLMDCGAREEVARGIAKAIECMSNSAELFRWLSYEGIDVEDDFLDVISNIEDGYTDLKNYKKDASAFDPEEIEFLKCDIEDWQERIGNIKHRFLKENPTADWEKQIENIKELWKK